MDIVDSKNSIHFGSPVAGLPDWRKDTTEEIDPDDELLRDTPEDVIAILGFDPLEDDES